jgi:hypothetical protein
MERIRKRGTELVNQTNSMWEQVEDMLRYEMRFPDFFLVGAPKAGTTSVYEYFSRHSKIFVPSIKEPHFFACPEVKNTYYDVPFMEEEEAYTALFEDADDTQRIGDFSPSYLFQKRSPSRIKSRCPKADILMILRNPVDRAISHYLMDVRSDYHNIPLADCIQQKDRYRLYYREYVEVGFYAKQVERYLREFASEQVHVWLFDAFASHTERVISEMVEALGLQVEPDMMSAHPQNRFQYYKYPLVKKIVYSGWAKQIALAIPKSLRDATKQLVLSDEKPTFDDERAMLRNIFADDIKALEDLIDQDLSHWLH